MVSGGHTSWNGQEKLASGDNMGLEEQWWDPRADVVIGKHTGAESKTGGP